MDRWTNGWTDGLMDGLMNRDTCDIFFINNKHVIVILLFQGNKRLCIAQPPNGKIPPPKAILE